MALLVKNPLANTEELKRHRFEPWVRKIPRRKAWQPVPLFLLGESMDGGVWWVAVHGVAKSQR